MTAGRDGGTPDPLYRTVRPAHTLGREIMGIPVRFSSNAERVIEVAGASFGAWPEPGPESAADPVLIRVIEHDPGGVATDGEFFYRIPERGRLLVHGPGSVGSADASRRRADVFVAPWLLEDRQRFRHGLLEAVTLFTLAHLDRQPFHAAGIVRGDSALLLAGPSGVGKSTLAYAAVRSGMRLLAEDAVYVQQRPGLRVWGMPGFIHLPPDARNVFPELDGQEPELVASGKVKLALDAGALGFLSSERFARRVGLCVLARGPGPSGLEEAAPERLESLLSREGEPGYEVFRDEAGPVIRALASGGGWCLDLGSAPAEALPYLEDMLDRLDTQG